MEKVLYLLHRFLERFISFVLAVSRFGHLAFSPSVMPKLNPLPVGARNTRRMAPIRVASSLVSHDDGEEDWSKYDVPAFIRRGIPMPKLEVVQPKKPAKRKKAVKKSQVVAPTETEARFEVVL
jgi:hypothetical protein